MSSIGNLLNTARGAILTHQAAVQTSSHNITNAQTEGYTRQRASLAAGPPLPTLGQSLVGGGVRLHDVARVRDSLLDVGYRRETAQAEGFGMRRSLLEQIEGVFGEPSETGLSASMDAFWSSWSDLANDPASRSARGVVEQRAISVARTFNDFSQRLNDFEKSARSRLESSVVELNGLATQVADLNRQIMVAEVGGGTASDLRDQRDRALDSLSKLGSVQVVERENGTVGVTLGRVPLVDGVNTKKLSVPATDPLTLTVDPNGDAVRSPGGVLGEIVSVVTTELVEVRSQLDQLSRSFADRVNALHTTGWSPAVNGTGVALFEYDPAVPSATIRLSSTVQGNPEAIAAGYTSGAGDNRLALDLAALRDQPNQIGNASFGDFYADVVSGVGLKVRSAQDSATVYRTLANEAETRRSQVSGVSTDEELVQLMHHQQAYMAATRLVNVADEMAQSILQMV